MISYRAHTWGEAHSCYRQEWSKRCFTKMWGWRTWQVCSLNDPPCFLSSATQCLTALGSRRSCYVTHVLSFGKSLGGERELHVGHCWAMLAGSAPRVVISIALNVSWCFHTIPAWLDNWLHLTAGVSSVHLFFKVYNILFTIWTIWSCTLLFNMLLDQE